MFLIFAPRCCCGARERVGEGVGAFEKKKKSNVRFARAWENACAVWAGDLLLFEKILRLAAGTPGGSGDNLLLREAMLLLSTLSRDCRIVEGHSFRGTEPAVLWASLSVGLGLWWCAEAGTSTGDLLGAVCGRLKQSFDNAIEGLDTVSEENYRGATMIMQVTRDILTTMLSQSEQIERARPFK